MTTPDAPRPAANVTDRRRAPNGAPAAWLAAHLAATHGAECIEWPFARNSKGYGTLGTGAEQRRATHLVLEGLGKPRPPSPRDHALHSCDNPACVNPKHLRWGSRTENMTEMVERGRAPSMKRENNPRSRLTEENVAQIRARYVRPSYRVSNTRALADEFGVAPITIQRIVAHRRWSAAEQAGQS